jgi:hypothetical protein
MLWLAFPALLLPAAVSVSASAAGGAVTDRIDSIEAPAGWDYLFPIIFVFVVFVSMVTNLTVVLARWPTSPTRGMPWIAGLLNLALMVTLALWASHFVWEARYEATAVSLAIGGSPFDDVARAAPVLCIGLSIGVFWATLATKRRNGATLGVSSLIRSARIALVVYLGLASAAIVARFMPVQDETVQNAINWIVVVLGAPTSLVVGPLAWMSPVVITRVDPEATTWVVATLLLLPVVFNAVWAALALRSDRFRERFVPPIALQ